MDLNRLHKDSRALVESLSDRLPPRSLAGYRSFSDAGEWAELVDELSATLVKQQIPVTTTERELLASVLAMFSGPREGYAYLSDPAGTLAGLTVIGEAAQ